MSDSVQVLRKLAYKAVFNYISNTLKLDKEYIFKYVDQKLEKFTKDWIEQRSYRNSLDQMIADQVTVMIKRGFSNGYHWHDRGSFNRYVRELIKDEVQKRVGEVIEVNINYKGKKDDQT